MTAALRPRTKVRGLMALESAGDPRAGALHMKPYLTIEAARGETYNHPDKVAVYRHIEMPRHSVLAGQVIRQYKGMFDTVEAAKAAFPDARVLAGATHVALRVRVAHLPDTQDS